MLDGAITDGAAGLWFLSTSRQARPFGCFLPTYMFINVGQAFLSTPTYAASLGVMNKHLLRHGSAIINTIQQLSGAAGLRSLFQP